MARQTLLVIVFRVACFGVSLGVLTEDTETRSQEPICIQVITCAKDGKYYPNPCQAVEKGGGIAETNDICEQNRKTKQE